MIRAVRPAGEPPVLLFDLGDVLVRISKADDLWPGQEIKPGALTYEQRWVNSQTVHDYETGRLRGINSFFQAARAEIGITITEEAFPSAFLRIIGCLFEETIPILTALKEYYQLYLLSNIGEDHWHYCRDQLGLGQFFEQTFLSYELGMLKPEARIFSTTLATIGMDPARIWYFDDRQENSAAARRFGMQSFTTKGGQPLMSELQRLNLLQ